MPANQRLCQIIGINPQKFSKEENIFLETELFTRICAQLKKLFSEKHKYFYYLIKQVESEMDEGNIAYCVVNDILSTKEYTLSGIAYYTNIPEDVIYDLALGYNKTPSATSLRKIIELHRSVRPELYRLIMEKVTIEFQQQIASKD